MQSNFRMPNFVRSNRCGPFSLKRCLRVVWLKGSKNLFFQFSAALRSRPALARRSVHVPPARPRKSGVRASTLTREQGGQGGPGHLALSELGCPGAANRPSGFHLSVFSSVMGRKWSSRVPWGKNKAGISEPLTREPLTTTCLPLFTTLRPVIQLRLKGSFNFLFWTLLEPLTTTCAVILEPLEPVIGQAYKHECPLDG